MSSSPAVTASSLCKKYCRTLKRAAMYGAFDLAKGALVLPLLSDRLDECAKLQQQYDPCKKRERDLKPVGIGNCSVIRHSVMNEKEVRGMENYRPENGVSTVV